MMSSSSVNETAYQLICSVWTCTLFYLVFLYVSIIVFLPVYPYMLLS
jgi:hypothetical protein